MKDLLNLFNQTRQSLDFDSIKIALASPEGGAPLPTHRTRTSNPGVKT